MSSCIVQARQFPRRTPALAVTAGGTCRSWQCAQPPERSCSTVLATRSWAYSAHVQENRAIMHLRSRWRPKRFPDLHSHLPLSPVRTAAENSLDRFSALLYDEEPTALVVTDRIYGSVCAKSRNNNCSGYKIQSCTLSKSVFNGSRDTFQPWTVEPAFLIQQQRDMLIEFP